jgi:hypothetical protein
MNRVRILCGVLWVAMNAVAESPQTLAERQMIDEQRAAIAAEYARGERDCRQQFAVTDCVNRLREQQRSALAALRERELQLDDAKRRAEVAAQQQRLAQKAAAAAAAASQAQAASASGARPAKTPAAPATPREPRPVPKATPPPTPSRAADEDIQHKADQRAKEAAAAAARVQAQQRRASAAAAHREEVERRNAVRAAKGKQAQPLPLPASAATR